MMKYFSSFNHIGKPYLVFMCFPKPALHIIYVAYVTDFHSCNFRMFIQTRDINFFKLCILMHNHDRFSDTLHKKCLQTIFTCCCFLTLSGFLVTYIISIRFFYLSYSTEYQFPIISISKWVHLYGHNILHIDIKAGNGTVSFNIMKRLKTGGKWPLFTVYCMHPQM